MATTHRLRSAADIRRTVVVRCAAGGQCVVVHALIRDDGDPPRVAVVAGRRVGNAVRRNRAKRRLREAIRASQLPAGTDLVVSAKPGADTVPFTALQRDLRQSVRRAHIKATNRAANAS